MIGRELTVPKEINSIVSLVPSITEFLYHIGLGDKITGRTVFCTEPKDLVINAKNIGGTKKVRYADIELLNPDIIICNKEENSEEIVDTLSQKHCTWVSNIKTLDDAYKMMLDLGKLFNKTSDTRLLVEEIKNSFENSKIYKQYTCLYLIWRKPYMSVGNDTFIHHLMSKAGFYNILRGETRYPELEAEQIAELRPEVVFLSSEPYPFSEKHIEEIKNILPASKIIMVDGDLFSWYGSRLRYSQPYFNELQRRIHRGIN
jgi:ABC-type Fe3+-hydroxamate transport system substrate-binding protein